MSSYIKICFFCYFGEQLFFFFFSCQHVGTLWLDACGMDWDLKPQKAMDGSHHHWDSLRRFNIHVAPSPCLWSAPLKCVQQSGKEIRPQFVAIGHFFCSGNWFRRDFTGKIEHECSPAGLAANTMIVMCCCMLLAYNRGFSMLVSFLPVPLSP